MTITLNDDIIMRTLTVADAEDVYAVVDANRAHIRQWLPWVDRTTSPDITRDVIEPWESKFLNGTDAIFGIFSDNKYIGNIGLHDMKSSNNSGMIGYWLAESAQGRGIMTACVSALIDYGFEKRNLNRIYITCAVPNKKSRAIPERLGFTLDGIMRDGELLYGTYYDQAVYAILKREWKSNK
jgi:ribosomal-protein-serine acetyltransferase